MTEETRCPACGAPLEFSGNSDVVRCKFCGTDLKVITDEDGHTRFQVLSQPEPQKEILDQPVEPAGMPPGGAQVYSSMPAETASYQETFPVQPSSGGAVAYPVEEGVPKRAVNRWVWISIAVLIGLGLFCICAILVVLAFLPGRVH